MGPAFPNLKQIRILQSIGLVLFSIVLYLLSLYFVINIDTYEFNIHFRDSVYVTVVMTANCCCHILVGTSLQYGDQMP